MQVFRTFHLGRKGVVMILMALLWWWIGLNVLREPIPEPNAALIHTQWPLWFRVLEWHLAALLAFIFAFRLRDWIGWVALIIPPALRAGSFIWGWVVSAVPDGNPGFPDGLWNCVLYLFMVGLCIALAGWPDYPPRPDRVPKDLRDLAEREGHGE